MVILNPSQQYCLHISVGSFPYSRSGQAAEPAVIEAKERAGNITQEGPAKSLPSEAKLVVDRAIRVPTAGFR